MFISQFSRQAPSFRMSSLRHFGIADSVMDFANKKMDGKKEDQFKEMITEMSSTPKWTLRPWKASLEKQLSGWTMYLPGVSNSDAVVGVKVFKAILDTMTEKELDTPESINGVSRERIAKTSGKSVDEVNKLMSTYQQSQIIAKWLHQKKKLGEKLPRTDVEMQYMQEEDPRLAAIARDMYVYY